MDKLFEWLSQNATAARTFIVTFATAIAAVIVMYLVAFFQGRELSFWPPKIGAKPKKQEPSLDARLDPSLIANGSILKSASGSAFKINDKIYAGSTSSIFRALDTDHATVAVKVYWHGLMPNSEEWDSFNREMKAFEVLHHRNIVKTLDRGLQGGYPFVVMEYLGGGTLRDLLESRDGHLKGSEIYSISRQIADAIDYAHSRGILHRDIKPGNVLLESDPEGRVALTDFGIARILGAATRAITAAINIAGTAVYICPEAIEGGQITNRSDIYSFGVVLYEMIARRVPFAGDNVGTVLGGKLNTDAPDIRKYRDVPEQLALRLANTLSRDPTARPSSAREVLAGMDNYILAL